MMHGASVPLQLLNDRKDHSDLINSVSIYTNFFK